MRILIAYGSTEGQTRKIVKAVAKQMRESDHEVELFDTSQLMGELHPGSFDQIIVAGSVHVERHQEAMELFVLANLGTLKSKPAMFLSVSLAVAFEGGRADAEGYVDEFVKNTGWKPQNTVLVAGAVRHGEYGYYKEHILEHIVLQGRSLDDPSNDHEFTDWDLLAKTIDAFVAT